MIIDSFVSYNEDAVLIRGERVFAHAECLLRGMNRT